MKIHKELAMPILRISLGLVFLYFGFQQISNPDSWISFIPEFLTGSFLSPNNLVISNGILELSLGTFLILGLYTRFSSLVLSVHLFFIAISIGFSPIGVRDFGLAASTLAVFFNGADFLTIDRKLIYKSRKLNEENK